MVIQNYLDDYHTSLCFKSESSAIFNGSETSLLINKKHYGKSKMIEIMLICWLLVIQHSFNSFSQLLEKHHKEVLKKGKFYKMQNYLHQLSE